MYYSINAAIKMNKSQVAKAYEIAKNAIAATTIPEDYKGLFAEMGNALCVSDDEIKIVEVSGISCDTCEKILPEILCAIASNGIIFTGSADWYSDYDTEYFDYSFDGHNLTLTATYHCIDDEPHGDDEDESPFYYDDELGCYVCDESEETMSEEEYLAACETVTTTVFNF